MMPGVYDDERPFDYPGSANAPSDPVDVDCFNCNETVEEDKGEWVVTYTHRIEGRAVAEDTEFICGSCLEEAEMRGWP